jgi:hypothetical protein
LIADRSVRLQSCNLVVGLRLLGPKELEGPARHVQRRQTIIGKAYSPGVAIGLGLVTTIVWLVFLGWPVTHAASFIL